MEKGVDIFVETVLILDKISKHRIKVKIVTNGGPLEELFNLLKMRKLRRVVMEVKKNVPWYKMPEEYSDSLILVNTSRSEVFGQSMAEALACNTYVIATETPGSLLIKSFVREGIEIVKCASAKSIANRILEALHNYETPNSRKYICEYLSGEAMARKWAKLLSSLTT